MAGVNFIIDIQTKGLEVIQSYKTEMTQIAVAVKNLTTDQKKLDKSTDEVASGMKKAEKQVDSMRKAVDKSEGNFRKFGASSVAALAGIGLSIAGITGYLDKLGEKVDQLNKAFAFTGGDFGDLQVLGKLANDVGLNIEDVADKIYDADIKITEGIKRGSGAAAEMFKELNMTFEDFEKLDVIERYKLLGNVLNGLPKDMQNLYADENGLKDLAQLTQQLGKFDETKQKMVGKGLLFTKQEIDNMNAVKTEIRETVTEFETFSNKVLLKALPQFNELLKQITGSSKDAFNQDGINDYSKYLTQFVGLVGIFVGVFKLLKDTVVYLTKTLGNFAFTFVDLTVNVVKKNIDKMSNWIDDLLGKFDDDAKLAAEFTGDAPWSGGTDGINEDEYNARKEAYDREQARKAGNVRKDNNQIHKEGLEEEKDIMQGFLDWQQGYNKEYAAAVKDNLTVGTRQAVNAFVNPEVTIQGQQDELERKSKEQAEKADAINIPIKVDPNFINVDDAKATQDKLDAMLNLGEKSGGISKANYEIESIKNLTSIINSSNANEMEKINAKLKLKEILKKTDEDEIKRLEILKALGEKNGGITAQAYNVAMLDVYKKRMLDVNATETEKLEAKLKISELQKKTTDDYYKLIEKNDKRAAAKQISEETQLKGNLMVLERIVKQNISAEETLNAQVKIQETKNKLLDLEKDKKEKIKALEDDMTAAQARLATLNNDPLKAFDLDVDRRMEEIKDKFKNSGNLQNRLDLEVQIINAEREEIELSKVNSDIEKLKTDLDKTNFFDFSSTIESQEKLTKLKEKQIELEKKHGAAIENTGNLSLFTNEKVKAITESSFDIMAKGLSNIMTQTDSTSKIMRQMLADILTEINKVVIRQIVLNAAGMAQGVTGGSSVGTFFSYFLSGLGKNHGGGLVGTDFTSGMGPLSNNESVRVLTSDELVLTKRDQQNLNTRLRSSGGNSSGTTVAVMDTEASANALVRTRTMKRFIDNN